MHLRADAKQRWLLRDETLERSDEGRKDLRSACVRRVIPVPNVPHELSVAAQSGMYLSNYMSFIQRVCSTHPRMISIARTRIHSGRGP